MRFCIKFGLACCLTVHFSVAKKNIRFEISFLYEADRSCLNSGAKYIAQWELHYLPLVRVNLFTQHATRDWKMPVASTSSINTESWWLAVFNSELWSVRYGDEFGLEFNYPQLLFCVGIGAAGILSMFFFFFFASTGGQSGIECLAFTSSEKEKSITCIQGFRSSWEARWQIIEKTTRHWSKSILLPKYHNFSYNVSYRFPPYKPL